MFELIDYKFTYHSRTCLHMNWAAAVSVGCQETREGGEGGTEHMCSFSSMFGMTIYGFSSER